MDYIILLEFFIFLLLLVNMHYVKKSTTYYNLYTETNKILNTYIELDKEIFSYLSAYTEKLTKEIDKEK